MLVAMRAIGRRLASTAGAHQPRFTSVTYGAGGSTRHRSRGAIEDLLTLGIGPVVGHLTCVGASCADTLGIAGDFAGLGIRGFVALRGDMPTDAGPGGAPGFRAHPDGFSRACDLVGALRRHLPDQPIYVAAYPEVHPEATSATDDLAALVAKAGADAAITQFFFDPEAFLHFRDRAARKHLAIPVWPGILPIENIDRTRVFAARCGASVPAALDAAFAADEGPEDRRKVAIDACAGLCRRLLAEDVDHLHVYTLNDAHLALAVLEEIGLAGPAPGLAQRSGVAAGQPATISPPSSPCHHLPSEAFASCRSGQFP